MKRYLLQYQRNADELMQEDDLGADSNNELHEAFNQMTSELNLATSGYSISACRDINEDLEGYTVNNRKVKQMLIAHVGEEICFTYPRNKSKPQMFYSINICPADLVETLRQTNPRKVCAEKLRKECEEFDFLLDNSYCDGEDLECSLKNYKEHRPKTWELFFNTLFIYGKESVHIQCKCDNIFQMIFNMVHNGQKMTLIHVGLSETVHDICCSKELIQIMNHMRLCRSYDEVEWLDSGLAQHSFEKAGVHRVPVPPSIEHGVLIQGAMDNFDHEESTKSGIGGSHDTILMLFQNTANEIGDKPKEISTKPLAEFEKHALDHVLDYQKTCPCCKIWGPLPDSCYLCTFRAP